MIDASGLSKANIDENIISINSFVKAFVPNLVENSELFYFVTAYQVRLNSKSCWKYERERCRYQIGKFFTDRTIIALTLQNDLSGDLKNSILNERVFSKYYDNRKTMCR